MGVALSRHISTEKKPIDRHMSRAKGATWLSIIKPLGVANGRESISSIQAPCEGLPLPVVPNDAQRRGGVLGSETGD